MAAVDLRSFRAVVVLSAVAALSFSSCRTVPEPSGTGDVLVVCVVADEVAVKRATGADTEAPSVASVTVVHEPSGESFVMENNRGVLLLAGAPAGAYRMASVTQNMTFEWLAPGSRVVPGHADRVQLTAESRSADLLVTCALPDPPRFEVRSGAVTNLGKVSVPLLSSPPIMASMDPSWRPPAAVDGPAFENWRSSGEHDSVRSAFAQAFASSAWTDYPWVSAALR